MIDNPSPELAEQIRKNGRSDDGRVRSKWGYRSDDRRIFLLEDGEQLPDGWFESPADVEEPRRRGRPPKVRTDGTN